MVTTGMEAIDVGGVVEGLWLRRRTADLLVLIRCPEASAKVVKAERSVASAVGDGYGRRTLVSSAWCIDTIRDPESTMPREG